MCCSQLAETGDVSPPLRSFCKRTFDVAAMESFNLIGARAFDVTE
jgi:hypothetical protein